MHAAIVLLVLVLTYLGMVAGRIAWLRVDRTGIALLAVIALLASGQMTLDDFGSAVDMPTLALLFAMMIISAQFAESGFFDLFAPPITGGGCDAAGRRQVAAGLNPPARPHSNDQEHRCAGRPADPVFDVVAARDRRADHRRPVAGQSQDHQPHDDRSGRLAIIAAGLVPVRGHRRVERCGAGGKGAGLPRRARPAAEQFAAAGAVLGGSQQRDRQPAGGDAAVADLADAAPGGALLAGAALDVGRQPAAERQPDQSPDRRAGRAHRRAAVLPRPRARRRADCGTVARLRGLLAGDDPDAAGNAAANAPDSALKPPRGARYSKRIRPVCSCKRAARCPFPTSRLLHRSACSSNARSSAGPAPRSVL